MEIDLKTGFDIAFWSAVALTALHFFVWWRASSYIKASIKAWWSKTAIAQEYLKTGIYRFYAAPIPKEYPEIIEKANDSGYIELRRKSKGMDENGNAIYQFSTERAITYSTADITGERWFEPELCYAYRDAITEKWVKVTPEEIKAHNIQNAKLWAKYPEHSVTPAEWVKFQDENLNPMVLAGALKHRELATARKYKTEGIGQFLAQNGAWLVAFLVIAWIIVTWMNQNNASVGYQQELMACKDQISNIYQSYAANGKILPPVVQNITMNTGGALVNK